MDVPPVRNRPRPGIRGTRVRLLLAQVQVLPLSTIQLPSLTRTA